jgi:hypothetical protein
MGASWIFTVDSKSLGTCVSLGLTMIYLWGLSGKPISLTVSIMILFLVSCFYLRVLAPYKFEIRVVNTFGKSIICTVVFVQKYSIVSFASEEQIAALF